VRRARRQRRRPAGQEWPQAARQAVENNWRNAAKRLSRVIGTHGERGSW
jgi:hypothetical protein